MGGIIDTIHDLFSPSGIRKTPFYTLRPKLAEWSKHKAYPLYSTLPSGIVFPSEFWTRVLEIYRHTAGDGHERAVTVWWVDGEFVLTENVRGDPKRVTIPKQNINVAYKPVKGTKWYERIITVNGRVYSKRSVDVEAVKKIKNVSVEFLFNMHTHPPHDTLEGAIDKQYYFFSDTDLKTLLSRDIALTGLVTDKLWLIFKTSETPGNVAIDDPGVITPEFLRDQLRVKVYRADFGKAAVAYDLITQRTQGSAD